MINKQDTILCVCNYGQVRSATMAIALRDRGYLNSFAAGAVAQTYDWLDAAMEQFDHVIVCNAVELGEVYSHEDFGLSVEEKQARADLFTIKYKNKVLISPIGRDVWGAPPNKPELRKLCDDYLDSIGL